MIRHGSLILLLLQIIGPITDGPRVSATVEGKVFYPGQAVPIQVTLHNKVEPITIKAPTLNGAEIRPVEPAQPDAHSFVMIPNRSGTLTIPPFQVRAGASVLASASLRVSIASLPSEGRPTWFLGGVGGFEVATAIDRSTVRVGQTLEYQIQVKGPAAWGIVLAPDLSFWKEKLPGLRLQPQPASPSDSASLQRTFRYKLRPITVGRLTLPPVPIAGFDPGSQRYITRYTPSVSVDVTPLEAKQALDTQGISGEEQDLSRSWSVLPLGVLVGSGLVLGILAFVISRRVRGQRQHRARRMAHRFANERDVDQTADESARRIMEGLRTYFQLCRLWSAGEMTPEEAYRMAFATHPESSLADDVQRLAERCDAVRFGADRASSNDLMSEARRVFGRLAKMRSRRVFDR